MGSAVWKINVVRLKASAESACEAVYGSSLLDIYKRILHIEKNLYVINDYNGPKDTIPLQIVVALRLLKKET